MCSTRSVGICPDSHRILHVMTPHHMMRCGCVCVCVSAGPFTHFWVFMISRAQAFAPCTHCRIFCVCGANSSGLPFLGRWAFRPYVLVRCNWTTWYMLGAVRCILCGARGRVTTDPNKCTHVSVKGYENGQRRVSYYFFQLRIGCTLLFP